MDFIEKLTNLSGRIAGQKDLIQTEEATRTAFVLPFISILEYDIFNPAEVIPEFTADVDDLRGQRVDYALCKDDGQVVMLIECKKYGEDLSNPNHRGQLARYFPHVDTQFAVLTDGVLYEFYTHLEVDNRMDSKPFLEFNMLDIQEPWVNELKRFTKSKFDPSTVIDTARILQYKKGIKDFMAKQLQTPSEDFVRFILSTPIYGRTRTGPVVRQFTGIIKEALHEFLEGRIQQRLQAAATREDKPVDPPDEDEELDEGDEARSDTEIIPEELEGFGIVMSVLRDVVDTNRIKHRDYIGFMSIRLDGDRQKEICRFRFNSGVKRLGIFDEEGNEERVILERIVDIVNYTEHLKATVQRYDTPPPSETLDAPSESPE